MPRKIHDGFTPSERVALFIAYGRATVHGRRGRLLECAHVVCFPETCVGGEKIAKYVWVFRPDEVKFQNSDFRIQFQVGARLRHLTTGCLRHIGGHVGMFYPCRRTANVSSSLLSNTYVITVSLQSQFPARTN